MRILASLLRHLKKRNLHLRAAMDVHVRDARDAEFDYRIEIEEIMAAFELVRGEVGERGGYKICLVIWCQSIGSCGRAGGIRTGVVWNLACWGL
jgi:hypothetical protein